MSELSINRTLCLPDDQYFHAKIQKDLIVLHYTAGGSVIGAFQQWVVTPEHVGTAFIIDRDGTIWEVFPPEYWAFHLGGQTSWATNQRSIGIELVNWGPLKKNYGSYYAWPNDYSKTIIPDSEVMQVSWRGTGYAHKMPIEQMNAAVALCDMLCDQFQIPRSFTQDHTVYPNVNSIEVKGIHAHENFRHDKTDIGPAFDWGLFAAKGFAQIEKGKRYL